MPHFAPLSGLLFLAASTLTMTAAAQAPLPSEPLAQLRFTAMEYLIYTDQLQKLDATPCGGGSVSQHSVAAAKQEILDALRAEDRPAFKQLFDSPQMTMLLQENSQGIAAVVGEPGLATADKSLSDEQRATCLEYRLVFQQNLDATRADLETLLADYPTP